MDVSKPRFEKYIFVCENQKEDGVCCAPQGSFLRETLKNAIKAKGLSSKIRVSRAGCLDVCEEGPNVLLMPDNIWFKKVEGKDIAKILDEALEGISR